MSQGKVLVVDDDNNITDCRLRRERRFSRIDQKYNTRRCENDADDLDHRKFFKPGDRADSESKNRDHHS